MAIEQTRPTGLFIMLTAFLLGVSFFSGHFLATNSITDSNGNAINVEQLNPNTITTNTSAGKDAGPSLFGWRYSTQYGFTLNWQPQDDPALIVVQWAWDATGFFFAMMTFQIKGAEILSPLWVFLSLLWAWLLILVARGNGG